MLRLYQRDLTHSRRRFAQGLINNAVIAEESSNDPAIAQNTKV